MLVGGGGGWWWGMVVVVGGDGGECFGVVLVVTPISTMEAKRPQPCE